MASPGADFDWADDDVRDLEVLNIETKLCKIKEEPEEKEKPRERKNRSQKSPAKNSQKKLNENRSNKSTQKMHQQLKCTWLTPEETLKELKSRKNISEEDKDQLKNILNRASRWNMFARTRKLSWPDEDDELKKVAEKIFVDEEKLETAISITFKYERKISSKSFVTIMTCIDKR
ncbi:unnamed protein product [Oikopleura dioica]|uniref:Uncharacterized protein n=1 Tax=Oikopleura dioica TaxID=34765 RepID=E4XXB2_OIKDI|nr:unnamed protein product [Oikopleura dioica]CBY14310.1 unnamed protein product [Oikopleura dioica]